MMNRSRTTSPDLRSFFSVAADSPFPIQNLPYGVFRTAQNPQPHIGVAIGDLILDLTALEALDYLAHPVLRDARPFAYSTLNEFMALGPEAWRAARELVSDLLSGHNPTLENDTSLQEQVLVSQKDATLLMPVAIGDYTDFYSSREHATNVGSLFRGPERALPENWLHLPIAYHGRSSSIILSGDEIQRPSGQIRDREGDPIFARSQQLDFELEVGCIIGLGNELGIPISVDSALEHVFGMVLVNDWSARDLQRWEYVPLGPFLGKNFATSISPWVVTMEALRPFRCPAPPQEPGPLPYLRSRDRSSFDLHLEAEIRPTGHLDGSVVCRTNFNTLYWTIEQQIAHHTVNGCNLRPGDLLASGTISGSEPHQFGSLLELTQNGAAPLSLSPGVVRTFLEDGDEITLRGWAQGDGYRVGFGEVTGRVSGRLQE